MSIFPSDKAIKLFPTDPFKKWQRYLSKTQSLLSLINGDFGPKAPTDLDSLL